MNKTVKQKLASRISENRRGAALTPQQDAALLAEYLSEPRAGERRPSYRSLAELHGITPHTVMRAIKRAAEAS